MIKYKKTNKAGKDYQVSSIINIYLNKKTPTIVLDWLNQQQNVGKSIIRVLEEYILNEYISVFKLNDLMKTAPIPDELFNDKVEDVLTYKQKATKYNYKLSSTVSFYLIKNTSPELLKWLNNQNNLSISIINALEKYLSNEYISVEELNNVFKSMLNNTNNAINDRSDNLNDLKKVARIGTNNKDNKEYNQYTNINKYPEKERSDGINNPIDPFSVPSEEIDLYK